MKPWRPEIQIITDVTQREIHCRFLNFDAKLSVWHLPLVWNFDSRPKESRRRERESIDSSRSDASRSKTKEVEERRRSSIVEDKRSERLRDSTKVVRLDDLPKKMIREDSPKKSKSKRKIIVKNEPLAVKLNLSQDSPDEQVRGHSQITSQCLHCIALCRVRTLVF